MVCLRLHIGLFALLPVLLSASQPLREEVAVTGFLYTRAPGSQNAIVIDRAEIEALGSADFAALLGRLPGLAVARRGPGDASFDLSLRGSHFEQVLLLVNGVPFNNPQSSHFLSDLPFTLADVERIEIVRGGGAVAYGAGAFAGVVNIVLRPFGGLQARAVLGGHRLAGVQAGGGLQLGTLTASAAAARDGSAGFYPGRESDVTRAMVQAAWPGRTLHGQFQAGWLDKSFGAAGFYAPLPSHEAVRAGRAALALGGTTRRFRWGLEQSWDRHRDRFVLDRDHPSVYSAEHTTDSWRLGLRGGWDGPRTSAGGGIGFASERMRSTSMGQRSRDLAALHFSLARRGRRGGADGGLRLEWTSGQPAQLLAQAGFWRELRGGLQIRGNAGRALRRPSFTELYYRDPANRGDPGLRPERSDSLELVLSRPAPRALVELSLFHRRQRDTIDWTRGGDGVWQARNIRRNDMAGCELAAQAALGHTRGRVGVERLWAVSRHDDTISKYALRFPDIRGYASFEHPFGRRLRLLADYQFKRLYRSGQQGHFLDIALRWQRGRIVLSLRTDNVLDSRLQEIPGVPLSGRWFSISLAVR